MRTLTARAFPIMDVQQAGSALKHYLPAEAFEALEPGTQVEQASSSHCISRSCHWHAQSHACNSS